MNWSNCITQFGLALVAGFASNGFSSEDAALAFIIGMACASVVLFPPMEVA